MSQKYSPIIAFAKSRLEMIDKFPGQQYQDDARRDELGMIVRLCEGMNQQDDLINNALGLKTEAAA